MPRFVFDLHVPEGERTELRRADGTSIGPAFSVRFTDPDDFTPDLAMEIAIPLSTAYSDLCRLLRNEGAIHVGPSYAQILLPDADVIVRASRELEPAVFFGVWAYAFAGFLGFISRSQIPGAIVAANHGPIIEMNEYSRMLRFDR